MNSETNKRFSDLIESIRTHVIEIETREDRIDYIISQIDKRFQSKGLLDAVRDDNITSMFSFQRRYTVRPVIDALEVYRDTGIRHVLSSDCGLNEALTIIYNLIES